MNPIETNTITITEKTIFVRTSHGICWSVCNDSFNINSFRLPRVLVWSTCSLQGSYRWWRWRRRRRQRWRWRWWWIWWWFLLFKLIMWNYCVNQLCDQATFSHKLQQVLPPQHTHTRTTRNSKSANANICWYSLIWIYTISHTVVSIQYAIK